MASKAKEIIISPLAADDLDKLYQYLQIEFGQSSVEKFHHQWLDFLAVVSFHPRIFPILHKKKNFRKHSIHPKTMIIYKPSYRHIEIITLFNTLQHPATLKKIIKGS